ncbi:MAG: histidine kinase dimerization/phospho-acceptor domain-containing protein [Clostridia bacterium]|nr:histidine kinase dimerization/phospho-acceptor domain-containing protein [Clostridia bacterium]MDD4375260.1 histidine kinase dimerization/phospho-acceptor domain-containing protein [Clostridia bacterium]
MNILDLPKITTQVESLVNYTLKEELDKTDSYIIDLYESNRLNTEFIILRGILKDGNVLILRSSVEPIEESAKVSNEFLLIVGTITIIVGGAIAFVVSQEFTRPIEELSSISESMANLDFSKKYLSNTKDEIGMLGKNINKLSEKLETTINDLKEVNIELEKDIEKKSRVDEMRKEFLADVSHELKTPISLIQGYAEGLVENIVEGKEDKKYYCEVILDEANKMDKLVQQLLTLSKIEYGAEEPNMQTFNIVKLAKEVIKKKNLISEGVNINLVLKNNPNPEVIADEFMIEQVITNYLINAIKHVNEKNIIEVTVENVDKGKTRVTVYNSGDTISQEKIKRLWDRFYKLDKSRSRQSGGSGIGLAFVKAVMTKHKNRFGVHNREEGVAFYFELDQV